MKNLINKIAKRFNKYPVIELSETDKLLILFCKGQLTDKYSYEGTWIDSLKPLHYELYGWHADEDNNKYDFLFCMFNRLLELYLKIQEDFSGTNLHLREIFYASFSKGISNDHELPIERAIHVLCGLIQNNRVIYNNKKPRYVLKD